MSALVGEGTAEIAGLNKYLDLNRRGFILCKPKHYQDIRAMTINGKLNKILGDVNQELRARLKH